MSTCGGYSLAFKRNRGHAGCEALLAHIDAPLSRYSVQRWEHLLGAACVVKSRIWFDSHYKYLCHLDFACSETLLQQGLRAERRREREDERMRRRRRLRRGGGRRRLMRR
eukprot:9502696-Pyramimonas_sp.AAC.1